MTKWIAGPWMANVARRSDRAIVVAHVVDVGGSSVAQMALHSDDLTEANAVLIAASPELYDCLAELIAASDAYDETEESEARVVAAIEAARPALAKARGEATR